jgi:mRNA-degrading endonuclease RelE of RelBE toxin-antitoxin system
MREYRPLYSDLVAEAMLSLPKRRQRRLLDTCNQLARNPSIHADYSVRDADGRDIEHILVDGFVIAYWVDHPVYRVMIIEVDDVQ